MLCDDLVVLQAGKVMEAGPSQEIFQRPKADYTRTLLNAVPYFEPRSAMPPQRGARAGEVPA
jgi:peptide/nickel transport system ATP-binding protein